MPNILLIDADTFLGSIYADALRAAGLGVQQATNGDDGIRAALEGPDAVVLDVMMPRMAAFEVLERLRAEPATARIPLVVMTELAHRRDIERCLTQGVAGYLIKAHHTPADLVQQLCTLLGIRPPAYAHI